MKQLKIKIYTTISCAYCMVAKEYFDDKGLEYESIDVSNDEDARKELVEITGGQLQVPVIVVGENVLCGFNKAELDELLDK